MKGLQETELKAVLEVVDFLGRTEGAVEVAALGEEELVIKYVCRSAIGFLERILKGCGDSVLAEMFDKRATAMLFEAREDKKQLDDELRR